MVSGCSVILMVDGPSRGQAITVDIGFVGRNKLSLEFGFMFGDLFSPLSASRFGKGSRTFLGDVTVDFAARSREIDGKFGTLDDQIFRLSDGALYVSEYFSDSEQAIEIPQSEANRSLSRNLVAGMGHHHDGIKDLTLMLHARKTCDGVFGVPLSTPVPLPAAAWLLGSGLVGLAASCANIAAAPCRGRRRSDLILHRRLEFP